MHGIRVKESRSQGVKGGLSALAVALVLVLVPFYAFLTVWGSTLVGHYTLLRLWPEAVLAALLVWIAWSGRLKAVWQGLHENRLTWLIAAYLVLNVLYYVAGCIWGETGVRAASYGLLLNTRHVVWFVAVYAVARDNAWLRLHWRKLVLIPLSLVAAFALLQFFVLPPDFLHHFGYVKNVTIPPAQTINQDTSTIRAQSTLRGPNPLGAYLLVGLCLLFISGLKKRQKVVVGSVGLLALFLSFSRSAWLGLCLAAACWVVWRLPRRQYKRAGMVAVGGVIVTVALFAVLLRTNEGFKNAVLHVNDRSTAAQTSNEDRVAALRSGVKDVMREPFGRGLGTAGPASMSGSQPLARNSENYFLGLAQEVGWLGVVLFVAVQWRLGCALFRRKDHLACMLAATLVGLTLVNLISYAWADVTLAYLWWGLAAIALAEPSKKVVRA